MAGSTGRTTWRQAFLIVGVKLRVMSRHRVTSTSCPLFPSKQTFVSPSGTSAWCQQRTSRPLLRTGTLHDCLVPSSHRIIPKYVCFDFQLSKTVLENITNADDPHELIAVLDRHMANTPHGHQLHDISHAVLR